MSRNSDKGNASTQQRMIRLLGEHGTDAGRNVERDKEVGRELKKRGWKVVRVWEHELKGSGLPRRFKAAFPPD